MSGRYPQGTEWKERHKHEARLFGVCAKCGRENLKRAMYTLYVAPPNRDNHKRLAHVCEVCLPALLDFLEVSIP